MEALELARGELGSAAVKATAKEGAKDLASDHTIYGIIVELIEEILK